MPRPLPLLPHPKEDEWTSGCGIVLEVMSIIGTAQDDAFNASADKEEDDIIKSLWVWPPPGWAWPWWLDTPLGCTAARSRCVTWPFSKGIVALILSVTPTKPPPPILGRVPVVSVQVVWDTLVCWKAKDTFLAVLNTKTATMMS